jgi:hypothetical protein
MAKRRWIGIDVATRQDELANRAVGRDIIIRAMVEDNGWDRAHGEGEERSKGHGERATRAE